MGLDDEGAGTVWWQIVHGRWSGVWGALAEENVTMVRAALTQNVNTQRKNIMSKEQCDVFQFEESDCEWVAVEGGEGALARTKADGCWSVCRSHGESKVTQTFHTLHPTDE